MAAKKRAKKRTSPATRRKTAAPKRGCIASLILLPFTIVNKIANWFPNILKWPIRLAGYGAMVGFIALLAIASLYYARARQYDMAQVAIMPERSVVFDKNGKQIGRIHGQKRDIVSLNQVAPIFQKAILAREDARFYNHGAVDPKGLLRAFYENIRRGSTAQGASTLTMQLSRNTFPLGGKTIDRKLLEIAVAFRIEHAYTKDEILEHYVNRIFWGGSIRGIEEASRTYFEKRAGSLTLSEAALLAGIVRGPNAFSPFSSLEKAERERNTTLAAMVHHGFLEQPEADKAKKAPINTRPESRRVSEGSYAMDVIRRELELILAKENITLGGLTINTTIDLSLQQIAQEALDSHLTSIEGRRGFAHQTRKQFQNLSEKGDPQYIQGAVVTIDNTTGAVRTLVGGRNADESQFNRAIQARRQVGSLFKPFVYIGGFERGLKAETVIDDGPIRKGEIDGAKNWQPRNSDGKYGGFLPAAEGLIHSRNTMSVRVGDFAGINRIADIAEEVGFSTTVPQTPSSYLGSWEASPLEVASAYTVFPNQGERYRPFLISSIADRDGNTLYKTPIISYLATDPAATWQTSQILREVVRSGTASKVRALNFRVDSGGKTGTTDDFKDAWFAGYTSNLTCAVWVGMDSPERTLTGGYGSTLSVPVWVEVMKSAARLGYSANSLTGGIDLASVELCKLSGSRATTGCQNAGKNYIAQVPHGAIPEDHCPIHPIKAQRVTPQSNPNRAPRQAPPRTRPPIRAQPVNPPPRPRRPLRAEPVPQPKRVIPAEPVR